MVARAAVEASAKFNATAKSGGWPTLCDPTLCFSVPRFETVIAIWEAAARKGQLPNRSDITPRRLKSMLGDIAIYERVMNGSVRYRVRLMGTAFAKLMGDLSGRFIDEVVPLESHLRWRIAIETALAAEAPVRFVGRMDVASKAYLVAEYFAAPLLDDDGLANLVLTASYFAPRRWAEVAVQEGRRLVQQGII